MSVIAFTNRGKYNVFDVVLRGATPPTNFYLALVGKTNEQTLDASAAVDEGSGQVGIPLTGHGLAAGTRIELVGTTNYDGHYIVESGTTTNVIFITATYVAETFAGTETCHVAPGPDTNTLGDLTEVTAGNGYTSGGISLNRNSTDFDVLTEDDTNDLAKIQIKDVVWTASGGNLPVTPARYAVLIDDNATVASREVWFYWDLGGDKQVSDTQTLTAQDAQLNLEEVA